MQVKTLELRDRATFIPLLAVEMKATRIKQSYLLSRAGYGPGRSLILITRLDGKGKATYDPYAWGDRTFHVAHLEIEKNWEILDDGDIVDVEFILGETKAPKLSEQLESYGS